MATPQAPTRKKKAYWLILPFIIIIMLALFRVLKPKPVSEPNQSTESPAQVENYTPMVVSFSPEQIIDMVEHDEDYIAGLCKQMNFKNSGNSYYQTHQNSQEEKIVTWSNYPNRLKYGFTNKRFYDSFILKLNELNPEKLPPEKNDSFYPNREHFLKNGCVFVDYGYDRNLDIFCVVAIKKEKLIPLGAKDVATQENNSDPNSFIVTSSQAYIYTGPYDFDITTMFLVRGKRVSYLGTNGEYIHCKYVNDAGVPIEGYLLVNDVARSK